MNKRKHSSSCSGLSIGPLFLTVVLIAAAAWYISGHWFQLMVITGDSMIGEYFRVFVSYAVITVALIMYETKKRNQKSTTARQLKLDQEREAENEK